MRFAGARGSSGGASSRGSRLTHGRCFRSRIRAGSRRAGRRPWPDAYAGSRRSRVENDEVESGARLLGERVAPLVRRPEEGIVERVEVGTLGTAVPLVPGSVDAHHVTLETRRRLDRARVTDLPVAGVVAAHLAPGLHVVGPLRDGLRLRGDVEPGRNVVSRRLWKSKVRYQAAMSSNRCERCMCVPCVK